MPRPVSDTSITSSPWLRRGRDADAPARGRELDRRSRAGSTRPAGDAPRRRGTAGALSGTSHSIVTPRASAAGCTDATAASAMARRCTGSRESRMSPATRRDMSSRSSTRRVSNRAFRSMTSRPAGVMELACDRRSTCVQPRIALSGVRSSCDSVPRKSSFSRLTRSASPRARRSCASSCSRSSSAWRRPVTSTHAPTKPTATPRSSSSGAPSSITQRYCPSWRRSRYSMRNACRQRTRLRTCAAPARGRPGALRRASPSRAPARRDDP